MRGKELQAAVVELGRRKGWRIAHFMSVRDSRGVWRTPVGADGKGFPDLLLVRDRVVALEVKGDGDSLKPEQELWGNAFEAAGVDWLVVTPKLWRDGTVDRVLA